MSNKDTGRKKDREKAIEFMNSERGRYLMGQALFYAIKELSKVQENRREVSNINDMKYIAENLYFQYYDIIKWEHDMNGFEDFWEEKDRDRASELLEELGKE